MCVCIVIRVLLCFIYTQIIRVHSGSCGQYLWSNGYLLELLPHCSFIEEQMLTKRFCYKRLVFFRYFKAFILKQQHQKMSFQQQKLTRSPETADREHDDAQTEKLKTFG